MFTHDTEMALMGAAALVNTMAGSIPGDDDVDRLTTADELDAFYASWQWTGSRALGEGARARELRDVRALRPRLRELWLLDERVAVDAVNSLLRDGHALPQLVKHDVWDYHLHATPPDAPLATRMAVEAAMAVGDVIRAGELDRLSVCDADDCDDVLVDLSKNRSRRFCDGGCGNRANVAAYRARKAAASVRSGVPAKYRSGAENLVR
jgi:predicted RNA-binding Zn ribbon-like protein